MSDTEAARSIHDVSLDDKRDGKPLGRGRESGYRHLLTEEQQLFLDSVDPAEQDRIFRKVVASRWTATLCIVLLTLAPGIKVDLHVVPMLNLLYLACHVDRANIGKCICGRRSSLYNSDAVLGNAKIEGLEADLNMKGIDYNIVAAIFFVPYLIFGKRLKTAARYSPQC